MQFVVFNSQLNIIVSSVDSERTTFLTFYTKEEDHNDLEFAVVIFLFAFFLCF